MNLVLVSQIKWTFGLTDGLDKLLTARTLSLQWCGGDLSLEGHKATKFRSSF